MRQVPVLGVTFDAATQTEFLKTFETRMARGQGTFVVTANPEIVMYARAHHDYQRLLATSPDYITADGVGIQIGARISGDSVPERVTGYDLMTALLAHAAETKQRVYLIGAKQAVVDSAVAVAQARWPGLNIVGQHDGYFAVTDPAVQDAVVGAQPDLVFAALGFPKQEFFLRQLQPRLPHAFLMGVGGSFDVLAGAVKRAPRWMQRAHLEWFYRLIKEPTRAGRMLVLPQFVVVTWQSRRHTNKQRG